MFPVKTSLLRALLVPDSISWITGTQAKNITRFNPWLQGNIVSGSVMEKVFAEHPELIDNYDLGHFLCQYSSKEWLPRLRERIPCVTTHHHVAEWELDKHNMDGDAIMVVSREWEKDLRHRDASMERVFLIPNGVDPQRFRPAGMRGRERRPGGGRSDFRGGGARGGR